MGTWNMSKAWKKMQVGHRRHLVDRFDVIGLTEIGVWSEEDFREKVGGYLWEAFEWFVRPRTAQHANARSASGGVAIGVKRAFRGLLSGPLQAVETLGHIDDVMGVRLSAEMVGLSQDVVFICAYIPPEGSGRFRTGAEGLEGDEWQAVTQLVLQQRKSAFVIMAGDLNAHTLAGVEGYGESRNGDVAGLNDRGGL